MKHHAVKNRNANTIAKTMEEAGFDVVPFYVDISSRSSVLQLIEEAQKEGKISIFINAAGVSEVFFEAGASAFW